VIQPDDRPILEEILRRFRLYGWTGDLVGEWMDVQTRLRQTYRQRLESGDIEEAIAPYFRMMFRTGAIQGIVSYDLGRLSEDGLDSIGEDFSTNLRTWVLSLPGVTDRHVIDEQLAYLAAPSVCEPLVWPVSANDGTSVSVMFDTPRHDWYARRCMNLTDPGDTILEVGGGYGGLAWQLCRRGFDGRMVIVDIPETLYLAYYFLSQAAHVDIAWYDEYMADEAAVVLVPAQEYAAWHDADLVFASHSICEMGEEVAGQYVQWIGELRPRWIYHDTARVAHPACPEVLIDQLRPGPPYREVFTAPINWAQSTDRYCEYLFMREP
jgi:hypothetical protein